MWYMNKKTANWKDAYITNTFNDFKGTPDTIFQSITTASLLNREFYLDNITPTCATEFDKFVRFWNNIDGDLEFALREPIKLYIDSRGGSLLSALTIIDTIKLSRTPIYTINIGNVFKESFYIYLAGLKRYSYPRASFYWEKDLDFFNMGDTQSNYEDFLEQQKQELKEMLIQNTKITESEYDKRKGWWLSAEKANTLHICNEVLRTKHI